MNDATSFSLPISDAGSGGGNEEVKWEIVTNTVGLLPAQVIAGHLQAAGIPARAWQESAGQAFGLTFGPLGTGYVAVPESYAEQAREILAEADSLLFDEEE